MQVRGKGREGEEECKRKRRKVWNASEGKRKGKGRRKGREGCGIQVRGEGIANEVRLMLGRKGEREGKRGIVYII